jgi:membrane protease YdiL (CAAX protease family)
MNANAAVFLNGLALLLISGSLWAWGGIVSRLWRREPPIVPVPRLPVPWTGSDMLLLAASFLFFEILAGSLAHALAGGETESFLPLALAIQSGTRVLWFTSAVAYLIWRGAYLDDVGWDSTHFGKDFATGVWLFLAASVPVLLVQLYFTSYLGIESKHPLIELARQRSGLGIMVLATIAAVGIAPWFEEFVFRVLLQGWLEGEQVRLRLRRDPDASETPGFSPLLIASLLFAAMHAAAGPDPVAIFVLSLFLGYAYRQTHRILPSIVIHAGVNGWTMFNLWVQFLAGPAA